MWRGLGVVCLCLLAPHCEPETQPRSPTGAVRGSFRERFTTLDATFDDQLWSPLCDERSPVERCGLLWARMLRLGKAAEYIEKTCQEDPAATVSDDCLDGLKRQYTAAIEKRYPRATAADIARRCLHDSAELCHTDANFLELEWVASHDEAVEDARASAREQLRVDFATALAMATREERAEEERQSEVARRVLGAIAAGLSAAGSGLIANSATVGRAAFVTGCSSDFECGIGNVCVKPPYPALERVRVPSTVTERPT